MGDTANETPSINQQSDRGRNQLELINDLYVKDIENLTDPEVQLSLSMEYALRATFPQFQVMFKGLFDHLHDQSLDDGKISTISYDQYLMSGLPQPGKYLVDHQHTHFEILEESRQFSNFDFSSFKGNIRREPHTNSTSIKTNLELAQQIGARKDATRLSADSSAKSSTNIRSSMNPDPSEESMYEEENDGTNQNLFESGAESTSHSEYLFNQSLKALKSAQADSQTRSEQLNATLARIPAFEKEKPIIMTTFNDTEFQRFTNSLDTYLIENKPVYLKKWLRHNVRAYFELHKSLLGNNLVSKHDEDFQLLLDNPEAFLIVAKQYLMMNKTTYKKETSDMDLVVRFLKLDFRTTDKAEKQMVITQFGDLREKHGHLFENLLTSDQLRLFEEFIRINNDDDTNAPYQTFIISAIRDKKPPIDSLDEALNFLLWKWSETKAMVDICERIGMAWKKFFPKTHSSIQSINNKRSFGASNDSGHIDTKYHPRTIDNPTKKTSLKKEELCYHCGMGNHVSSICGQDSAGPYFNNDSNSSYSESAAWAKCKRDLPNIEKVTTYPKIPSRKEQRKIESQEDLITNKALSSDSNHNNKTSKPKSDHGNKKPHENKYGPGNNKHAGGRKYKCKLPCSCIDVSYNDDEHVANILAHDKHSHLYNKVNILSPGLPSHIIATTFALIDTGALHGSYTGTSITK